VASGAGNFRGFEKPKVRPQLIFFLCGLPSVDFLNSEEMCGCAAHYFTKCAVIQGSKIFWGRGNEFSINQGNWVYMVGKTPQVYPSQGKRDAREGSRVARRSIGMQAQGLEQMGAQQRVQELGAPQRVQEVPRAQQQVLERGARPAREHHGTPPPLVLLQLPPLVLNLLPLLLLSLLLLVLVLVLLLLLLLVLLLQAA